MVGRGGPDSARHPDDSVEDGHHHADRDPAVYVVLRPVEMKRLWPAIVPALMVVHFALPGTMGSIRESFFPKTGLITVAKGTGVGSGRLTTLGPALDTEFSPHPVLGEGFGSRITGRPVAGQPKPNGPILDDGWLGILLETGVLGTFGFFWLFVVPYDGWAVRQTGSRREDCCSWRPRPPSLLSQPACSSTTRSRFPRPCSCCSSFLGSAWRRCFHRPSGRHRHTPTTRETARSPQRT